MANGSWLIPAGGETHAYGCECGWCAWTHELELRPHSRYQDCLMAMWFCESAAREYERRSPADDWAIDWGRDE